MFNLIIGIAIGLVVGWVILPEPAFVRNAWARVTGLVMPTNPTRDVTKP